MSELIVLAAIPLSFAALIGYWLPRFSFRFLGPAVIVLAVVACAIAMKELGGGPSDAWGPGLGILILMAGAVGVVAGLILIFVGVVRASSANPPKARAAPVPAKPFRLAGPGLFTPARLLVVAVVVPILVALFLVL